MESSQVEARSATTNKKISKNRKTNLMKKALVMSIACAFFIVACKTAKTTTTNTEKKPDCSSQMALSYAADIKPIFENQCNNCHSNGGRGGYDFTIADDVNRAAKNGALLGAVKHQSGYDPMPARAPKLDDMTISKLECWINNGMKP